MGFGLSTYTHIYINKCTYPYILSRVILLEYFDKYFNHYRHSLMNCDYKIGTTYDVMAKKWFVVAEMVQNACFLLIKIHDLTIKVVL